MKGFFQVKTFDIKWYYSHYINKITPLQFSKLAFYNFFNRHVLYIINKKKFIRDKCEPVA